jgi:hypothetical protein
MVNVQSIRNKQVNDEIDLEKLLFDLNSKAEYAISKSRESLFEQCESSVWDSLKNYRWNINA